MFRSPIARACAPLLLAVSAHAQDDPRSRGDIVVTAAIPVDRPAPDRQPGGIDRVAAAEFADSAAVSLRDALAFSPGVYTQPRFGQEVRLSIRGSGIGRGFHTRGILLMQDDVPINTADNNGDFQELDPLVLERIDVVRGANALAYGAATLGGVVNGITPTGRSAAGVRLRVDGGSFGTMRALASIGVATGRGDAFLAVTGDRSYGDRDHADRRGLRLNGNVGLELADGVSTRLHGSVQRLRQELPGSVTLASALDDPRAAAPAALTGDQARDIDSIRLQNRTVLHLGEARIAAGGFLNLKTLDHPIFEVVDQKSTDGGVFARAEWARGPFTAITGVTARFGTVAARRFVNRAGRRGAITFRADQVARTIDTYGELRLVPVTNVTLIAGVDRGTGMRRQDIAFPAVASGRATFSQTSPRLGILIEPVTGVQLYANRSRAHEMPGFTELAQVAAFVPLAAQRGWTWEAGGRGTLGPARFDLALYRSDLRGELLQFTVSPSIPAATFNAGRTRHQGVEAGVDLDLASWATLRQVYTLNDFTFRGDAVYGDHRLPVIPRHFYRAELRLTGAGATIAPRVEWAPRGAFADYTNSVRLAGYALLGLTGDVGVARGMTLFVDARNLTDKGAAGDVSAVVTATPASAIIYPVERRAFYAGLRTGF